MDGAHLTMYETLYCQTIVLLYDLTLYKVEYNTQGRTLTIYKAIYVDLTTHFEHLLSLHRQIARCDIYGCFFLLLLFCSYRTIHFYVYYITFY